MTHRSKFVCLVAVAAIVLAGGMTASADTPAQKTARKVFKSSQDAVLWVQVILKIKASAGGVPLNVPAEQKVEVLGTVLDADNGLMVVSNSRIDPVSRFDGRTVRIGGQPQKVVASSEFSEVKVRMTDGTEVPAKVLHTDAVLDLAYVQIDTDSEEFKGHKLTAVDMSDDAKAEELDDVIMLARLGKVLNYAAMVDVNRVVAMTTRPRTFYVAEGMRIGCPVFTGDGKVLGVSLVRRSPGKEESEAIPVILPARDVLDGAKDALAAHKDNDGDATVDDEDGGDDESADEADDASGEANESSDEVEETSDAME